MRKDTLIMIVAMVVITMGVYYGLETFVRSHDDAGHGGEAMVATETSAETSVAEVAEPATEAAVTGGVDEMELVEAPAEDMPTEPEAPAMAAEDPAMEEMAMTAEEPAAEEPAMDEMAAVEEEPAAEAPTAMAETSSESAPDTENNADELTEIAVQAAIAEAVKAAAEAAEQAVREAMQARSEQ